MKDLVFEDFLKAILEKNTLQLQEYLKNSLFYYCSGKDITPILALKDRCSVFVYVDKLSGKDFEEIIQKLFANIQKHNCVLEKKESINIETEFKNAILSQWKSENCEKLLFLYVKGDAIKVFKSLYELNGVVVVPKCICNIKYEMNTSYFLKIEKNIDFIMGHCYSKNHSEFLEFEYKGDYNIPNGKVWLYKNDNIY